MSVRHCPFEAFEILAERWQTSHCSEARVNHLNTVGEGRQRRVDIAGSEALVEP